MLTNLYFIRHAHSKYTPDELYRPLSEQGQRDAERITQLLEKENIDYIFSSPYKRAVQTVKGIAGLCGKEVIIENAFKERLLSEGPVENFDLAVNKVWDNPSFSWQGGESNNIAQKRGVEATFRIINKYSGRNIVIGTHGNIMVLIMNYFNEIYGFNFWKALEMPDVYKLTFDGTSLKKVKRIWK